MILAIQFISPRILAPRSLPTYQQRTPAFRRSLTRIQRLSQTATQRLIARQPRITSHISIQPRPQHHSPRLIQLRPRISPHTRTAPRIQSTRRLITVQRSPATCQRLIHRCRPSRILLRRRPLQFRSLNTMSQLQATFRRQRRISLRTHSILAIRS